MRANEKPNGEPVRRPEEEQGVRQVGNIPDESHPVPLFLRGGSDGRKGDAQDEKDGTTE